MLLFGVVTTTILRLTTGMSIVSIPRYSMASSKEKSAKPLHNDVTYKEFESNESKRNDSRI